MIATRDLAQLISIKMTFYSGEPFPEGGCGAGGPLLQRRGRRRRRGRRGLVRHSGGGGRVQRRAHDQGRPHWRRDIGDPQGARSGTESRPTKFLTFLQFEEDSWQMQLIIYLKNAELWRQLKKKNILY